MSIALIQELYDTNNSGDLFLSLSLGNSITTGNSLILVITMASTNSINTIDLGLGVESPTLAVSKSVAGVKILIYYKHNSLGNYNDFEITTTSTGRVSANISEWSGLKNAAPEDIDSDSALLSTAVTTPLVSPSSFSNLVIVGGGWTANNYSSGPTNSFTRLTQTGGVAVFQEAAYLIQAAASDASSGWTLTAGINWASVIAVFGTIAAGPTPTQRQTGFFMRP